MKSRDNAIEIARINARLERLGRALARASVVSSMPQDAKDALDACARTLNIQP